MILYPGKEEFHFKAFLVMRFSLLSVVLLSVYVGFSQTQEPWVSDNGDGTYKNPIIHADYSDPDVCRVGDDFYMTSSSFNAIPGLPILHSKDLVNWTIINHALQPNADGHFDIVQHGNGVWAPSIRFHNGLFYIYWGDPDRGIFMVQTDDPKGKWSEPILVKKAYGNIDACPLWDDDGKVYMVHAFAHSRAGINCTLQVVELSPDGSEILDKGRIVFDGHDDHPTMEGPKFYKRNGYYYIFAPAGGVPTGWQVVMRSKNVYGPYEDKIVLAQGSTNINGPHQGGLIELENGESWFLHFQDKEAYGRIVHMEPVTWINDWPVMGNDADKDGTGEPVMISKKPKVKGKFAIASPQTSDEFQTDKLGLQWQWQANPRPQWYSFNNGSLTLRAIGQPEGATNLWPVPNLMTQKLPAETFSVTAKMNVTNLREGEEAGFVIFGLDYAGLNVQKKNGQVYLDQAQCKGADKGTFPISKGQVNLKDQIVYLQIKVSGGKAEYAYSKDGVKFDSIGEPFVMREGKWVGAKIAMYTTRKKQTGLPGFVDIDWIRFNAN